MDFWTTVVVDFAIWFWFFGFLISFFFLLEVFQVIIIWGSLFNRRHGRHCYFCGPWSTFQKNHQTTGKVLHSVLLFRTSIIYLHSSYYVLFYFFRGFYFFDILFLQGGYFGMVGIFCMNLGSLSKKNHQTTVMDLHSVPSNSFRWFGDLLFTMGVPMRWWDFTRSSVLLSVPSLIFGAMHCRK